MQLHAPGRWGLRVGSVGSMVAVEGSVGGGRVCAKAVVLSHANLVYQVGVD